MRYVNSKTAAVETRRVRIFLTSSSCISSIASWSHTRVGRLCGQMRATDVHEALSSKNEQINSLRRQLRQVAAREAMLNEVATLALLILASTPREQEPEETGASFMGALSTFVSSTFGKKVGRLHLT